MRNLITKLAAATASLVLTVGLVALASPAAASQIESQPRHLIVRTADLNLAAPAGRLAAERRIRTAAGRVCTTADDTVGVESACRSHAIEQAIALLDLRIIDPAGKTR